jgi:hypothetical protein
MITPIRLHAGCYPLRVSPRTPAHNKVGDLYGKSPKKHGYTNDRYLRAESEHSPSPSRLTLRSGKRLDRIFSRQTFTSKQMDRSRRKHVKEEHTQNSR